MNSNRIQSNIPEQHMKRNPRSMVSGRKMNAGGSRRRISFFLSLCFMACVLLLLCSCGAKNDRAVYEIHAEGTVEESGVLSFAGQDMSVYEDEASNPCGDCPDQPVSIYVGTGAADALAAMEEALIRADDLWEVVQVTETDLILQEKVPGSVTEEPELSAPKGLTLTGSFHPIGSVSADRVEEDRSSYGTESSEETRQIVNLDGKSMTVPVETPEKIAAVYGPAYEALVLLGAEERIVVCSDVQIENFPWAEKVFSRIGSLPRLENVHSSVNTEELKRFDPDLVLTFRRPNELKQMEALGLTAVYGVTSTSLSDVPEQLRVYADAVGGDAPERAEAYREYFNERLEMVKERTSSLDEADRPTVYYAGIDILTTYGNKSDLNDVIEAAGGRSVTAELNAGNHTQIDFEQLAQWNPDVIYIDHGSMNDRSSVEEIRESVGKNQKYQAIAAVQNDAIYLTPSGVFYWDMGLQKILLVMQMAKTLHPDLFEDLDLATETMDFYSRFFNYDLSREDAEKILAREDPS